MLLSKEVEIVLHRSNVKYFEDLGYKIPREKDNRGRLRIPRGTKIIVKVEDLSNESHALVKVKCDCRDCTNPIEKFIEWRNYKKYIHENNLYYCNKCATKIIASIKISKTKLKNGISFAQWGIDNLGEDFLEIYWSNKNIVNPWEVNHAFNGKVYIKCQKKEYHDDYLISCNKFIEGKRCPYCSSQKVHPLDSLGKLLEDKGLLEIWSDKNEKTPYEYAPNSIKEVWWKCPDGKHKDYRRSINHSNIKNFKCPFCSFSKGEQRIEKYFKENIFIKDEDYMPQREFDSLIGLGGGNLSYDFYLPKYNLLIEYQGEMHDRFVRGIHKSKKDFEKQQEHDKRKREYAKNKGINLLEIWYYDFDNIEKILDKELNKIKQINSQAS